MRLISEKANLTGASLSHDILRISEGLSDAKLIAEKLNGTGRKEKLISTFTLATSEFEIIDSYPEGSARKITPAVSQNILKAIQLKDLSGQRYLAQANIMDFNLDLYIPIASRGSRDILLITQIHLESIPQDLKSLVRLIAATIGLMLLIQIAIGFLIYRILIKPIKDVSIAAIELGNGHFSTLDIPRRQRDEILLLVESFNQMSIELQNKDKIIRNQIEELSEKNDTMDFELEIAERIQKSILPDGDKTQEVQIALEYDPLYKVSGDFYDFVRFTDGSIGIIIADASGHGVPAAFLTILMKVFFTDLAQRYSAPAVLMREINLAISRFLENTGFYLTAFYIRIYPSLEATYCNCGHPAQLCVRETGELFLLENDNNVIGLIQDIDNFASETIKLSPNDKLILFTDGLTELKNMENQFLPEEEFHSILVQNRNESSDALRTRVLRFAEEFRGERKRADDLTLLILTAKDILNQPVSVSPGEADAAAQSQDQEIARLLGEIIKIQDSASYYLLLINAYLRLGKPALARETLKAASEKHSTSPGLQKLSALLKAQ